MLQALLEQGLRWLRWRGKYFTMVLSRGMENGTGEFTQQLEELVALAKVLGLIQLPHGGSKPTVTPVPEDVTTASDFCGQQNA